MNEKAVRIAYLDDVMGLDEYRDAKNQLIREREKLSGKLESLATQGSLWVEPFRQFVKVCQEAASVAAGDDAALRAEFLRNRELNLTLRDRRLKWDLRGGWQLVENEDFVALQGLASRGLDGSETENREEEEREWSRGELNPRAVTV